MATGQESKGITAIMPSSRVVERVMHVNPRQTLIINNQPFWSTYSLPYIALSAFRVGLRDSALCRKNCRHTTHSQVFSRSAFVTNRLPDFHHLGNLCFFLLMIIHMLYILLQVTVHINFPDKQEITLLIALSIIKGHQSQLIKWEDSNLL